VTLEWRLRRVMAEQGVWTGAELARLLWEQAGYRLTAPSISDLLTRPPRQLKVETLDALCTALACSPADLLAHTPSRRAVPAAAPAPAAAARAGRKEHRPPPPGPAGRSTARRRPRSAGGAVATDPRRLPCRACGQPVALPPSWRDQRRSLTCAVCLAGRHLARLLAPAALAERVPQPWARALVERYAAFLVEHGASPDQRWRKVRRVAALGQRMGWELAGPEQLTAAWLDGALAGEGRSHRVRPSLLRFLRAERLLPAPTEEERWLRAIAAGLARVPARFRGPVRRYTDFRVRVHREQRRRNLAHVLALRTVAADVRLLCRVAEHLGRAHPAITGWDLVTEREVVAYLRGLAVHPNSRNVQRWDLHSFFAYCLRHRLVAHNPVPDAPGREAPSAFRPLTPDAQRLLLERWARLEDPLESLLGCFALLHGLGSGDVQRLRLADVDRERRRVRVAGRPVALVLDALTRHALEAYLAVRPSGPATRHNPHLVLNAHSRFTAGPVTQRYLGRRLRPLGLSLRALRMTCLSTVAQESGPRLLVDAFGLSPTQAGRYQRFLAHRADQALAEHAGRP